MRYSDMPKDCQPVHRLRELGAKSLSTSEIIAVAGRLYDSDAANQIVTLIEDYGCLGSVPRHELLSIDGVGPRVADSLEAISALLQLEAKRKMPELPQIQSPDSAANLVQYDMQTLEQEQMRVIILNTRNNVLAIRTVYQGTINACNFRTAELFKSAIRMNAAAIIIVHNHPTGDPTPSPDDIATTKNIVDAGKMLDIQVLDHLVIGKGRYISMKERNLGF